MATTTKLQLKCALSDGSTATINLPPPRNNTLTDVDTGQPVYSTAVPKIKAAFATDSGATVNSITFNIIQTTTTIVAENYTGN